jgi:predicted RNase H-like HicB family nuclease
MIIEYCQKAIERAEYKKLADGSWFADIPGFQGVWANGDSVEQCRNELVTVLEEWLLLKVRDDDSVPDVAGLKVEIREVTVA